MNNPSLGPQTPAASSPTAIQKALAPITRPRRVPFLWVIGAGVVLATGILFGSLLVAPAATQPITNRGTSYAGNASPTRPEERYGFTTDNRIAKANDTSLSSVNPTPIPQAFSSENQEAAAAQHIASTIPQGQTSEATIMGSHDAPPWSEQSAEAGTTTSPVHVAVIYDAAHGGRPTLVDAASNTASYLVPAVSGAAPLPATIPQSVSPAPAQVAQASDGSSTMVMPDVESTPGPVTIPAGTQVRAVLDHDIDSDLPGPVRAHILEDVCDPRTGAVAIPRGSWLLGDEGTGSNGARHLSIAWARLTYPDLTSRLLLGTDTLDGEGHAGVAGRPNVSGWATFRDSLTSSIAASAGTIASQAVASHAGGNSTVVIDAPSAIGAPGSIAVPQRRQSWSLSRGTIFNLYLERDFDRSAAYRGERCGSQ